MKEKLRIIGEAVAIGSIIMWIITFCMITYNGLTNGIYKLTIDTNHFNEHYIELIMFIIGLLCYLFHCSIFKFKLKEKKGEKIKCQL